MDPDRPSTSAVVDVAVTVPVAIVAAARLILHASNQGAGCAAHSSADSGTPNISGYGTAHDGSGRRTDTGATFSCCACGQREGDAADGEYLFHDDLPCCDEG